MSSSHDDRAGHGGVHDLEQREAVAVGRRAEDADDDRHDDHRDPETGPGGPRRQRDDGPQQIPRLHHRKQQHRAAQRDAEPADRVQPATQHGHQQPADHHRDDQDADATGQRQHGGGVIAQAQQNADLPGAQRDQRRRRHPAAHHVGGAQRVDPAEAEPAGPADGGHHRQRQSGHQPTGQQERPQVAAPALGQRHRDEAQRQQRRQLDLRGQRDQDRAGQQHAQRRPVRPSGSAGPRPRAAAAADARSRYHAARTRCRSASARASAPRCGCRRPDA